MSRFLYQQKPFEHLQKKRHNSFFSKNSIATHSTDMNSFHEEQNVKKKIYAFSAFLKQNSASFLESSISVYFGKEYSRYYFPFQRFTLLQI